MSSSVSLALNNRLWRETENRVRFAELPARGRRGVPARRQLWLGHLHGTGQGTVNYTLERFRRHRPVRLSFDQVVQFLTQSPKRLVS